MILNSKVIFDAHTHVHFPAYDKDQDEVIKRAQAAGVKMITVGTNLKTSQEAILIAEKYPEDIWATVGFHPSHVFLQKNMASPELVEGRSSYSWYFDKNELREPVQEQFNEVELRKIASHPKVVAIGECGLDYFRIKDLGLKIYGEQSRTIKDEQKKVFLKQIKIAQEVGKPLMIHCRPSKNSDDAYLDLIPLIPNSPTSTSRGEAGKFLIPPIIHFFVGSLDVAKKFLATGFYFTFGGVITFVRDYDEVIKFLPLENILLETDAPYVTPEPYRSINRQKRNEPAYVIEVAKKIAEIKNLSLEKVIEQTSLNINKVFILK